MKHRKNSPYGENLYCKFSSGHLILNGKEAVEAWYSEIKDYKFSNPSFSNTTGHFTQVIWKHSKELGVGMAIKNGRAFVVANYDPPGNFQGKFSENVLPLNKNYR